MRTLIWIMRTIPFLVIILLSRKGGCFQIKRDCYTCNTKETNTEVENLVSDLVSDSVLKEKFDEDLPYSFIFRYLQFEQ